MPTYRLKTLTSIPRNPASVLMLAAVAAAAIVALALAAPTVDAATASHTATESKAAGKKAAKPAIALPSRAPVNGRQLTLTLRNPRPASVRGTLVLRLGKKGVARTSFELPAKGSRALKLKLPKAQAHRVAVKRRLALRLSIRLAGSSRAIRRGLVAVKATKAPGGGGKNGGGTGGGGGKGGGGDKPTDPPTLDGAYSESNGWTMAVEDGLVKGFSGSITTYCTVTRKQKNVYFAMIGDDPFPTIAADGSYSWEATTNYGFVKLKFDGRITDGVARGKMMVEDRSMIFGSGRIEFDYCFAGREYEMTREQGAAATASSAKRSAAAATTSATRTASASAKRPAGNRWRITNVKLDGWSQHLMVGGGDHFEAKGRVSYRTKGKLTGPATALPKSRLAKPVSVNGITWTSTSEATLSTEGESWNCSHTYPPMKARLAGAVTVGAKKVRVQWSLAPTHLRCPAEAPEWSFPGLPLKAMTSTFPRRLLNGRTARIPVEIEHRWRDEAGVHEVHWDGTVVMKRSR